jgi:hypothetical protein
MKYFNGGLLTLSLASLAGQAASLGLKYLNHRELEKALLDYQDDPEAIAQEKALYKALVDTSYEEVENRLKEVNLELQGNPADQNRKSYLLDKKAELEALLRERDQKTPPTTP